MKVTLLADAIVNSKQGLAIVQAVRSTVREMGGTPLLRLSPKLLPVDKVTTVL